MKTRFFKYLWLKQPSALGGAAMVVGLLLSFQATATTVTTLGGGPYAGNTNYYGYSDGNTKDVAQFHTPIGLALDSSGNYLFVADRNNNAIRELDLAGGNTYTFTTNFINRPVGVAVDGSDDVFVLNRGNGTNGNVLEFDAYGDLLATDASALTNAAGIALAPNGNIYVTASNRLFRITAPGVVTTVATITNAGASLSGVVVMSSGQIAVADAGRDGIYTIDPSSGVVTTNTGFNGPGDHFGPKNVSQFLHPYGLAQAGNDSLVVADYGNNRVKVVDSSGTVTNLYGVDSNYWVTGPGTYPGWYDGTVVYGPPSQNYNIQGSVEARLPAGIVVGSDGTAYVAEDYYHIIREVTGGLTPPPGPPPPPPVPPAPTIGYVTFSNSNSVLKVVSSSVFTSNVLIAIEGTNGAQTFFTSGPTGSVPSPSTNSSTAPFYQDGLSAYSGLGVTLYPDTTIKAVSVNADGEASPVTTARFRFVTANPTISGNNAAKFIVYDLTPDAEMYYTTDDSNPTNNGTGTSIGPIFNGDTLSLNVISNLTFKIRAFRPNFQPSAIVSDTFSVTNFIANTITFGFSSGEASSDFIGAPGQTFYAPVTLTTLPKTTMYSLQFNTTVTNAGPNPGPSVAPGAFDFKSMLEKPIPGTTPPLYETIPPLMFSAYATNPPPASALTNYDGLPFVNLATVDTNLNLIGVGWLERYSKTNLYDTTKQTLITYSQAHDDLFPNAYEPNGVIVGGYGFVIPGTATNGQTYQIQIGRPSATSDGIGAPGSDVYIATPTNGSLTAGAINSIKIVTVGQRKYLVGDAYPFRWFNAGDFGDSNLDNADVEQVFQSAVYHLNTPPTNTDFYDSMDSCGGFGVLDPNTGYYTNAGPLTVSQEDALFNGNDSTINQIAFGNGKLDVCDVYVTFRRSLDPSLTWFDRFWQDGQRVAEAVPNVTPQTQAVSVNTAQAQNQTLLSSTNSPQVNFTATDVLGTAGQTVQIPIKAEILGAYPLRVLMLNLTVDPLDGSPPLTTAVSFTPNPALGTPTMTDSDGNNNYAAAWLNSTIAGLTGTATVGTLTVTIPTNVNRLSAYAVHFDEASGSPNGLASFPESTLTGLITLSSQTNSCYGDGIPDSWRLRWFGTTNDLLSVSNACPSGDGVDNWEKYIAGVNPNTPDDFPSVNPAKSLPAGATAAISWPTVSGKHYVIMRSRSLFPGSWTAIATNIGTGAEMEFDDTNASPARFYRVLIQP